MNPHQEIRFRATSIGIGLIDGHSEAWGEAQANGRATSIGIGLIDGHLGQLGTKKRKQNATSIGIGLIDGHCRYIRRYKLVLFATMYGPR